MLCLNTLNDDLLLYLLFLLDNEGLPNDRLSMLFYQSPQVSWVN